MYQLIEINNINSDITRTLSDKISQLNSELYTSNVDVWLYVLSDGFVYRYSDVYCVANSHNKVYELILLQGNKINLIDTKHVSRHSKPALSQVQVFLHLINEAMTKLTKIDLNHVILLDDRLIEEIKYEIVTSFNKRSQ